MAARWLAAREFWLAAGICGITVVWERAQLVGLVALLLFWPLRRWMTGRWTVRTPLDWVLLLLLLWLPVTLWATPLPALSIPQLLRLLIGIALYYALANWANSPQKVTLLLPGISLTGILVAFGSLVTTRWQLNRVTVPFTPVRLYNWLPTFIADPIHPNVVAGTLLLLLPVPLAVALFAWGELPRWHKAVVGAAIPVMGLVLLLTQSRAGILALLALLVILITWRWRWGWLMLFIAGISAAILLITNGPTHTLTLLTADSLIANSAAGRLEIWSRAITLIQLFPLTGIGMGTFGPVTDKLFPFFLIADGSVPHAHNIFLQITLDLGIFGLIFFSTILFTIIKIGWQQLATSFQQENWWLAGLNAGIISSQIALITFGLLDTTLWGFRTSPVLWALWGVTIVTQAHQTALMAGARQ